MGRANHAGQYCVGRAGFGATWLATTALGLLLTIGCSLHEAGTLEVATALEQYRAGAARQAAAYVSVPPATSQPIAATAAAAEPDSLRAFIVEALEHNPDIRAARDQARSRAERIAQVTALPDPMLMTKTLPEPTRTAEGDNFFLLGVQQKFPVPEKLDRRGRIALEQARVALAQLQQTRLRVIADVKRAYYQLYVLDRTIELIEDNQVVLQSLLDVAQRQVAAGRPAQDALRAQVELSNLDRQLIDLRQRRVSAEAMLNTLVARDATTKIPTPPTFGVRDAALEVARLFALARKRNPALQAAAHELERDQEALRLAQLAYWPDFTLGFEWMQMDPRGAFEPPINPATGMRPPSPQLSEEGHDNWAIVFGFNLPIWYHKIKAGIREARFALAASRWRYDSTRNLVFFRITDALERVRAQRELALLFDRTIIPQAQQAYEVSRDGYAAGTNDFEAVMDNWERRFQFSIQYHRALGELERTVADLEQNIGMSLTEVQDATASSGGPS